MQFVGRLDCVFVGLLDCVVSLKYGDERSPGR